MARIVLSEQTADRIQQLINKQYKPGDKIPAEMELASFMDVSRTTIREAVKILCSRNILEIKRGSGTFVCENPGMPRDPLGSRNMDEQQLMNEIFEMSHLFDQQPYQTHLQFIQNSFFKASSKVKSCNLA